MKSIIVSSMAFIGLVLVFVTFFPSLGIAAQEPVPDDLGVSKGGIALFLVLVWRFLPAVAAVIPDGEKGILGVVRRLARVLGISPKDKE